MYYRKFYVQNVKLILRGHFDKKMQKVKNKKKNIGL